MARKLALVSGIPRMVDESASPTIYDETLDIVASSPGAGEIVGPISTGTPITLPSSKTYNSDELEVRLDGQKMDDLFDYIYEGTIPRTQISFAFDIWVGARINFRIDRGI